MVKKYIEKIILKVLHTLFVKKLKSFRGKIIKKNNSCFLGEYLTWEEAKKFSTGYDASIILDKVKDSMLKVKSGEAVYERDSVLFDKIQYSWALLANLLWIASKNNNELNIIDFGGSLGSTYFQNINYLKHLNCLRWNVVEQKSFVDCGREFFEDENLKFFYSINECLEIQKPDVIILSSVLQYLEQPYGFLEELINYNFRYIIFDRTFVLEIEKDKIMVQVVPENIYNASYPCWFFSLKKFLSFFHENYRIISDFEDYAGCKEAKGFFFERRDIS